MKQEKRNSKPHTPKSYNVEARWYTENLHKFYNAKDNITCKYVDATTLNFALYSYIQIHTCTHIIYTCIYIENKHAQTDARSHTHI